MSAEKTRVLVVDDEAAMRAMAKAMLEGLGFESVLANSGEQAVDLYHQSLLSEEDQITMAIMDLTLPGGMSGVEALQELHEMDEELPVVATSGYLEENAYEICQQIGFVGVLPKPYNSDKLRELVHWVVSRKGVPGGYSEGMPMPESEPKKEESRGERAEGAPGQRSPVQTQSAELSPEGGSGGNRLGARSSDGESELYGDAGNSRNGSPQRSADFGSGIAERLEDLADIAVSHRGEAGD